MNCILNWMHGKTLNDFGLYPFRQWCHKVARLCASKNIFNEKYKPLPPAISEVQRSGKVTTFFAKCFVFYFVWGKR